MVTFDSSQTPIWSIPFPSLTICNMNKVRRSRVDHIDEELLRNPESNFYKTEKIFVKEVCSKHERFINDSAKAEDLDITGQTLKEYLSDLAHPCEDMLVR